MSEIKFIEIEDKLRVHYNYGRDVTFHPIGRYRWNKSKEEWYLDFKGLEVCIGFWNNHLTSIPLTTKRFMEIIKVKGEFKICNSYTFAFNLTRKNTRIRF